MISNLKDLEKLIKLCRKQGLTEISLDGFCSFKLGDLPLEERGTQPLIEGVDDPYKNFPQGELSPEQLMFYSSGGSPDQDPEREAV